MHFTPPPYLDPGSGSVILQLVWACLTCGSPIAAASAIFAFFLKKRKSEKIDLSTINKKE